MTSLHRLTFGDVSRENRRGWPQHTAVVDGDVRLSYAAFDDRTNRLARDLLAEGVESGDRLIWIAQNSFRALEVLVAAAKIGAVLCVANWRQTEEELGWLLADWAPKVVFWEPLVAGGVESIERLGNGSSAVWIEHSGGSADGYEARLARSSDVDPELPIDPASGLVALYTGAFDGKPSAVVLSHDAVIAHDLVVALQRRVEVGANSYLICGPLFHVGTMMWLTATFHLGGKNVFLPKFQAEEAARLIETERVQAMMAIPSMLDDLAQANERLGHDLSSLAISPVSEALNPMVSVDDSAWGRAVGGYGQTEVGGMMTYAGLGGRSSPLLHVRIVDDSGVERPTGEVGEIVARGLHIMNGYHGRDELNAHRRRDGWHHTGDLGRREADGTLTFIGPMCRMIKSGGENIYIAEVELALVRHAEIAEAAVIGVPDSRWGQSVQAIVVRTPGSNLDEGAVIAHCMSVIASYKKPRHVVFAEAIPRQGYSVDYDALDTAYGGGGYPGAL